MGLFDGFQAQLNSIGPSVQPKQGLLSNIQSFLANNRGEGNFAQRLGQFGAQMQDLGDGGQRAANMNVSRARQQQAEAEAAQRQQLNQMAQALNLDPREALIFQANPEAWASANADRFKPYNLGAGDQRMIGSEVIASRPANPTRGVNEQGAYEIGPDGFEWLQEFEPDPLEQEYMRARIAATQAQAPLRQAQAAKASRPAAIRGGGRSSGGRSSRPAYAPSNIRWD